MSNDIIFSKIKNDSDVKKYFLYELEDLKIITLGRGNVISKNDIKNNEGDYPVYSSSAIGDGEIGRYGKYMFDDVRISWSIDGGGKFFYRTAQKYSITNVGGWIKVLNENFINPKYLYYFLINEWMKKKYDYTKKAHPSTIKKEYMISIPNIKIQNIIVNILDKFKDLEAELEAELEARKLQCEFYRTKLLISGNQKRKLKEIAYYSKDRINHKEINKENYISVENLLQNRRGKISASYVPISGNSTKYEKNDILIGNIRPYLRKIWFSDITGGTNGDVLAVKVKNKNTILPKYLFYVLSSENFFEYNISNSKGAKMPRGDKKIIMEYEVIIPPLEAQKRIVNILDKFDILINDINEGLPAEIEMRRKQYAYYRNKLLSFEEVFSNGRI